MLAKKASVRRFSQGLILEIVRYFFSDFGSYHFWSLEKCGGAGQPNPQNNRKPKTDNTVTEY
jgi:hypothetical protein